MKRMKTRILVVDDDEKIRRSLSELLVEQEFEVVEASDGTEALERFEQGGVDLVLLDYQLPDFDGLKVLEQIRKRDSELPVVMMSGYGTIKLAVKATRQGAYDFLEKPLDEDRLVVTVRNAVEKHLLQREVAALRAETLARYRMVGNSPAMSRVYDMIDRAAPSKASVLILGENGVGKELAARAIHRKSLVASGPFVRINCAAIPDNLIESELFGHEKGAFTGAVIRKPGKLELGDKGTVFLDEVGDMSLPAQAKLLRFLQEGEVERVGGTQTLTIDVRVIAATNKSLKDEIGNHRFREDLFYRLNVVTLKIPSLRERREDIALLAEHFLAGFCEEQGVSGRTLSDDAVNLLAGQSWPGNVRELANVIQRCVVLLPQNELSAKDIGPLLTTENGSSPEREHLQSLKAARSEFERKHILGVLAGCKWNMTEAARVLELDRTGLYKALERLGIKSPRSADR